MSEKHSLGELALIQANGNPNAALAELMVQVVGMLGFISSRGTPKEVVLECYDAVVVTARTSLVSIMEEDEKDARSNR